MILSLFLFSLKDEIVVNPDKSWKSTIFNIFTGIAKIAVNLVLPLSIVYFMAFENQELPAILQPIHSVLEPFGEAIILTTVTWLLLSVTSIIDPKSSERLLSAGTLGNNLGRKPERN